METCLKNKNLLSAEEENELLKRTLYEVYNSLSNNDSRITNTGKIVSALQSLKYVEHLMPNEERYSEITKKIYGGVR